MTGWNGVLAGQAVLCAGDRFPGCWVRSEPWRMPPNPANMTRRLDRIQGPPDRTRTRDLLLQVRCAVYNGTLGTGFGRRFQAANDPHPPAAIAA